MLPFGFLSHGNQEESKDSLIVTNLIELMAGAEPNRWTLSAEETEEMIRAHEVLKRLMLHHTLITDIFKRMYKDVAFKITPVKMNLSLFRSQPYFQLLETSMAEIYDWSKTEVIPKKKVKNSKRI